MIELSFDLDERICKMIEALAREKNKSKSEVLIDAIARQSMEKKDK